MFVIISAVNETDALKSVYDVDVNDLEHQTDSDVFVHFLNSSTLAESLTDLTENFETPFVYNPETNNYVLDLI